MSVTKDDICNYESGKDRANIETLMKFADIYQVDLLDILYGDIQHQYKFKKYKITGLIIVSIMLIGILIHNTVLFISNKFLSPADLIYGTNDYGVVVNMRLALRKFAEITSGISSAIFIIGIIVMLYSIIKYNHTIELHKLFIFFSVTIAALFACALPFAIYDKKFWGDYLFPLWSVLIIMVLLFSIMIGVNFIKRYRKSN